MSTPNPSNHHQKLRDVLPVWFFILVASVGYFSGLSTIPFHPDEATQIYMSRDVHLIFTDPKSVLFDSSPVDPLMQDYRLVDAPLTRTMIGLGLSITSQQPISTDWDWSASWDQNLTNGAVPDESTLFAARLAVSWVVPLTLWFVFATGRNVGGKPLGWLSMLLFALNALILLHTRRAMAESTTVFTVAWSLAWITGEHPKRRWLIAVPVALAFCSKQSVVGLLMSGLIAVAWPVTGKSFRLVGVLRNIVLYGLVVFIVLAVLNPVYWRQPIHALRTGWMERMELLSQQSEMMTKTGNSAWVLDRVDKKLASALYQIHFSQPQFAETANYSFQTAQAEDQYLGHSLNHLFSGVVSGMISLLLTVIGFILLLIKVFRAGPPSMPPALYLITTTITIALVLAFTPFSYQRYYVLIIPILVILQALPIAPLISWVIARWPERIKNRADL